MYSTEQFMYWLRKQKPKGRYTFNHNRVCCFAMFLKSKGHKDVVVGLHSYSYYAGKNGMVLKLGNIPYKVRPHLVRKPHTYGKLLERIKADV